MTQTKQYGRLGKFELHELIGEGAMGVVWKAYDPVLRRYVALKRLGPQVGKTKEAHDRFLREARAAAALRHANVASVFQFGLRRKSIAAITRWSWSRAKRSRHSLGEMVRSRLNWRWK